MSRPVTITKVDDSTPPPPPVSKAPVVLPVPAAAARPKRGKTTRTFPRGILKKTTKIKGVRDPARPPPVRKGVRKHTLRVLTERGIESRRKTVRQKIQRMKDDQVRTTLQKAGVSHNEKTPPGILREMLEGGVEAGMISLP